MRKAAAVAAWVYLLLGLGGWGYVLYQFYRGAAK